MVLSVKTLTTFFNLSVLIFHNSKFIAGVKVLDFLKVYKSQSYGCDVIVCGVVVEIGISIGNPGQSKE